MHLDRICAQTGCIQIGSIVKRASCMRNRNSRVFDPVPNWWSYTVLTDSTCLILTLSQRKASVDTRAILGTSEHTRDIGRWMVIGNRTDQVSRVRTVAIHWYWQDLYKGACRSPISPSLLPSSRNVLYLLIHTFFISTVIAIVIAHGAPWSHSIVHVIAHAVTHLMSLHIRR